jgi:hypothetical protein
MESVARHGAALLGAMAGTLTGLKTPWWVHCFIGDLGQSFVRVGYRQLVLMRVAAHPSDDYFARLALFRAFFLELEPSWPHWSAHSSNYIWKTGKESRRYQGQRTLRPEAAVKEQLAKPG